MVYISTSLSKAFHLKGHVILTLLIMIMLQCNEIFYKSNLKISIDLGQSIAYIIMHNDYSYSVCQRQGGGGEISGGGILRELSSFISCPFILR